MHVCPCLRTQPHAAFTQMWFLNAIAGTGAGCTRFTSLFALFRPSARHEHKHKFAQHMQQGRLALVSPLRQAGVPTSNTPHTQDCKSTRRPCSSQHITYTPPQTPRLGRHKRHAPAHTHRGQQALIKERKQRGEDLLLCQVPARADYHHGQAGVGPVVCRHGRRLQRVQASG